MELTTRMLHGVCLAWCMLLPIILCGKTLDSALDLSWGYNNETLNWPTTLPFSFIKKTAQYDNDTWYASNQFCVGEHAGTHLDAPYHFSHDGWKVGDIPLERLIVPGIVLDLSEEVNSNPEFLCATSHLQRWEKDHGEIPANSVLIVRFGWAQFYQTKSKYFGTKNNSLELNFPGLSAEAAQWIVNKNKIVGVAVDTPSIDASNNQRVHQILLGHNIYGIENLKLFENLPARDFTLIVMPMKITDGTGGPCRVVAIPKLP